MNETVGYTKIGSKNMTVYLRYCYDLLSRHNKIKIQAYGNNISKAIYVANIIQQMFDGRVIYSTADIEVNTSRYTTEILCSQNSIDTKLNNKCINKCKKCGNDIVTNQLYKDLDVYCTNCITIKKEDD